MKKIFASLRRPLVVLSAILATLCWASSNFAQQGGLQPFPEKHVGGDVPVDESSEEAMRRGRGPSTKPREDRVLKDGALAPSKDDRAAYATFLRNPNTGLIRLLPSESVARQSKKSQPRLPGEGSYYSFANVTHSLRYGSDIELNSGQLSVGFGGRGYGFMTNLGDVPLEDVTLTDKRARFLAEYRPAVTFLSARAEALRFQDADTVEGVRYQNRLPAEPNATYLLRSVNYGQSIFAQRGEARASGGARPTDVLVAFRVVRADGGGGLTIAWKLLKKYSAPQIQ